MEPEPNIKRSDYLHTQTFELLCNTAWLRERFGWSSHSQMAKNMEQLIS